MGVIRDTNRLGIGQLCLMGAGAAESSAVALLHRVQLSHDSGPRCVDPATVALVVDRSRALRRPYFMRYLGRTVLPSRLANGDKGVLAAEVIVVLVRLAFRKSLIQNICHCRMVQQLLRRAGKPIPARVEMLLDGSYLRIAQHGRQQQPASYIE